MTYQIRPLQLDEIEALKEMADNGRIECSCGSSPDLCICSTIIMACDELLRYRRNAEQVKESDK